MIQYFQVTTAGGDSVLLNGTKNVVRIYSDPLLGDQM